MATRLGLAQTAGIFGIAAGGLITKYAGPGMGYAVLGVGLVILALYAIAAGRSTTNPLHGAAYERATIRAARRSMDGNSPSQSNHDVEFEATLHRAKP